MWIVVLELLNILHRYFLHHSYPYLFLFPQARLHTNRRSFCPYLLNHPTLDYVVCSGNWYHTPVTGIHQPVLQCCLGPARRPQWIMQLTLQFTKQKVLTSEGWVLVSGNQIQPAKHHGKDSFWDHCKNIRSLFSRHLYCHAILRPRYMKSQKPSFNLRIVTNCVHY